MGIKIVPIGKGKDRHPKKKKTRKLGAMPLVGKSKMKKQIARRRTM